MMVPNGRTDSTLAGQMPALSDAGKSGLLTNGALLVPMPSLMATLFRTIPKLLRSKLAAAQTDDSSADKTGTDS